MKQQIYLAGALALTLSASITQALDANTAAPNQQALDRVVAIVDDDVITFSDLQDEVQYITAKLKQSNRPMPPDEELRRQVFDQLVVESLELQLADRAGARVNDTELNEAMERIAAQNGMTLETFSKSLSNDGMQYTLARERLRREILIDHVQRGNVNQRVKISDQEIDNFLDSAQGQSMLSPQYHVKHVLVPVASDASTAAHTEARQKAESLLAKLNSGESFEQLTTGHSDLQASDLGWRRDEDLPSLIAPAVTTLKEGAAGGPIVSASGYHVIQLVELRGKGEVIQQTKARHILLKPSAIRNDEQSRELAAQLRTKIIAGTAFADLARQYSEDIGSAMEGGELGWTSPGQLVPAFQNAMDNTTPGAISDPFRSNYGWHIVQVEERRQQDVTNDMRRNMAREYLHKRKYQEELEAWLHKIRDEAYVDIKKL